MTDPGWYYADGDAPGTQRYWDGSQWVGDPVAQGAPAPAAAPMGMGAPGMPMAHGSGAPVPVASPGMRMGARIIDVIIYIVIALVLALLGIGGSSDDVVIDTDDGFEFSFSQGLDSPFEFLLLGLIGWGWVFAWTHLKGGTPGKLILGMRIADEASLAYPVGVQQALIRTATSAAPLLGILGVGLYNAGSGIVLLIGLVSLILLFSDDRHRTVMDRLAKTLVIKV